MKDDPGETNDLAAAEPELVRELNTLISDFLVKTEAVVPKRNPDFKSPLAPGGKKDARTRPLGPLQGWVPRDCIATVQNGLLSVTGINASPFLGFALGTLDQPVKLHLRVRGAAGEGKLVWMPGVQAAAAELKSASYRMAGDDWQVVRFHMACSATSKTIPKTPGYPSDMVQRIMGATSSDGIHWEKTCQPLLIRQDDTASPRPEPDRIGDFHRPRH